MNIHSDREKLIRTQADLLVDGGYLAAGYNYIIIDDCWLNHTRSAVRHEQSATTRGEQSDLVLGWIFAT